MTPVNGDDRRAMRSLATVPDPFCSRGQGKSRCETVSSFRKKPLPNTPKYFSVFD